MIAIAAWPAPELAPKRRRGERVRTDVLKPYDAALPACVASEVLVLGRHCASSWLLSEFTVLSPRMSHWVIANLVTVPVGPLLALGLSRLLAR